MVVTHKIESYKILILSNYAEGGGYQMGYIHLYGKNDIYLGYLGIIKDRHSLPKNSLFADGTLHIYFEESGLQMILNTLRTSNQLFVTYNTDTELGSLLIGERQVKEAELAA